MRRTRSGQDPGGLRQVTTGALMIAAGVLLLLTQQGIIHVVSIWLYWPVALIVVGTAKVVSPRPGRDLPGGVLEVLAGLWFLACNFHWQGFTYRETWPLLLVAIGLSQVLKALGVGRRSVDPEEDQRHA